jgi:Family of unknown function (DUF6000)
MERERRAALVDPYYLAMMQLNGLDADESLLRTLAASGRTTSSAEVAALLGDAWRERVMGAWFALFHDERDVGEALARSLETAAGSLAAPPLAVAAVRVLGAGACDPLARYAAEDAAHAWGACGFAAAALTHLGSDTAACPPTAEDRHAFAGLLAVAHTLASMP